MGHLSFHHGEGFAHSSMMQQARVTRHTCQRPRMRDGSCGGGGGNVTIGRSVATKGGKTSLHIPLWQVGQVARGRRAVGAAFAAERRFSRAARPEKSLYMDFPGKEVVEKSGKFPQIAMQLATTCRLMGDTCHAFRGDLPRKPRNFRLLPLCCSFLARCKEKCLLTLSKL